MLFESAARQHGVSCQVTKHANLTIFEASSRTSPEWHDLDQSGNADALTASSRTIAAALLSSTPGPRDALGSAVGILQRMRRPQLHAVSSPDTFIYVEGDISVQTGNIFKHSDEYECEGKQGNDEEALPQSNSLLEHG